MASRNLDKLSLKELIELQADVEVAIETAREKERISARQQIEEMASARGLSLDDLFPGRAKHKNRKGSYPPPKALYHNPSSPKDKPWTGRGKRPNWLTERLDKGAKLDEFKVSA